MICPVLIRCYPIDPTEKYEINVWDLEAQKYVGKSGYI